MRSFRFTAFLCLAWATMAADNPPRKPTPAALRSVHIGYDRIFLIGEGIWRNYDVRTTITRQHISAP